MKCYIFNSSTSPENAAVKIESMLDAKQMEKVSEEAQKLASSLIANGVKKVKIYGSNRSESNHAVSLLVPVLEKYGLMSEEDVFLSADFRDRDYGRVYDHSKQKIGLQNVLKSKEARSYLKANINLENAHGIEKKGDFTERVFDSIASVLERNAEDATVILVVGDEFIKTCQKNEDIHSMFYFGDEHLIDPRLFRMRHFFSPYNADMVAATNDAMINDSTLRSRMQLPYLSVHEAILEVPKTDGFSSSIEPVYHKYARIKLAEEIKERDSEAAQASQKE